LIELTPGLKKEDLHVQVEDDRTLYISYGNQPKEDAKDAAEEGEASADRSQSKEQKSGGCSFKRKFKLPENAELEQIKAEVTNETLTVTVPKRKPKSPEIRNIEVSEGGAPATNPQAASSAASLQEGEAADKSEQLPASEAQPSTSTA
jgi:HSP20 family protein